MSEELTPRQQILLWDLVSRGGSALQKDLKPEVKPVDREPLRQKGLVAVSRGKNNAVILTLNEDKGWDHLGRTPAALLMAGRGSTYDRPVLQFVIERVRKFAESNGLGLSQVFLGKRIVEPDKDSSDEAGDNRGSIEQEIANAFSSIAGRPAVNQVRLRLLRERLSHISRGDLDRALVAMRDSHRARFSTLSNPPDIAEEGNAGLTIRGQTFHTIWIDA